MTDERTRLRDARLYLLATRTVAAGDLLSVVAAALEGGVDVVQLREKDASTQTRVDIARELLRLCRKRGALLLVNDDVEAALQSGADGVHLGQEDVGVAAARAALGPGAIVGVSTHDGEELRRALADGADYVGVGSAFPTRTKGRAVPVPGPEAVGRLVSIAEAARVPAFAIGGITADNIGALRAAGVTRVAVCAGVLAAADPRAAAAGLRRALD